MTRTRRLSGLGVGLASFGLLLAGCSDQPASAAAVVGEQQVSLDEISDQLHSINDVLGVASDAVDASLTNAVLRNNVVYELVEQAAAQAGVEASQTDIDQRLASQVEFIGSRELLDQQAAQAGVAPQMVETDIRVSLLAADLQAELAKGSSLDEQGQQQALLTAVQQYSEHVGTTVNPRFGVWDVSSLSITADPDAPSAPPSEIGLTGLQ